MAVDMLGLCQRAGRGGRDNRRGGRQRLPYMLNLCGGANRAVPAGLPVQPEQDRRQAQQCAQRAGAGLQLVAQLIGEAGASLDQPLFCQVALGIGTVQAVVKRGDAAK